MQDRWVEEIVPITLQTFIGNVPDECELRQQDPTEGVGGHLADGELDQGRARATELASTAPMT